MYRMLIVDDEAIIADGLQEVFQSLDTIELDVYKAYSGDDALKILDKVRMDIVLTDIRMPGIDGLQLMKEIRERWPQCKVIFLTGYDEFEYVYTAIQYEGVNYILKTEGYSKIISVVESVVSEIELSLKNEELLRKAQEQLDKTTDLLQRDYFNGILKGEVPMLAINEQQFEELGIPLKANFPVLMLLGSIDEGMFKVSSYSENYKRLYSVRLISEQYFSSHVTSVCVVNANSYVIWFIQPHEDMINKMPGEQLWNGVVTFVKENLELVQNACRETLGISISFVLDDAPVKWGKILHRFSVLKMIINYRIGNGQGYGIQLTGKSIAKEEFDESRIEKAEQYHMMWYKIESMANYLENGNKKAFNEVFEEFAVRLKQTDSIHNIQAQNLYYSLALVFYSHINQWNLVEKVAFEINLEKLMQVNRFKSWDEAVAYLYNLKDILFDIQDFEQEKRAEDVIDWLKSYIYRNIHDQDELSLVRLADQVHFNPSYLSRLFKQKTGLNLSDYISDIRVQKAKELLQDMNMKIYEVAQALGYSSSANFVRFFRKATEISPQEYRDILVSKSTN